MTDSIYTYALIKALYDEGQDYIDSFWPFVVKVLPSNQSVHSSFIQKRLKTRFKLEVPLHVLGVILARAARGGYIRHWRDERTSATKYRLTTTGINYSTKLETDKEVDRRTNALLDSIRKFFEEKGISLSFDKIRELLLYFLHKNIDSLIERINPSISSRELTPPRFKGSERHLLDYIRTAEQQEPDNYRILEDLVFGSIVSVLLYVKEPEEITKMSTTKFSDCKIFLDTNFIFSMLDLDIEEACMHMHNVTMFL